MLDESTAPADDMKESIMRVGQPRPIGPEPGERLPPFGTLPLPPNPSPDLLSTPSPNGSLAYPASMTYDEAIAFWYGRINYEVRATGTEDQKLERFAASRRRARWDMSGSSRCR